MLVGANGAGVDEQMLQIRVDFEHLDHPNPDACLAPTRKALVGRGPPPTELPGHTPPWTAGAGNPQFRFDKQPAVGRRTGSLALPATGSQCAPTGHRVTDSLTIRFAFKDQDVNKSH
jgi:hypothetical protein